MTPGEVDAALDMDDATGVKVLHELRHEVDGAHRYALETDDAAAIRRRTWQLVALDKAMDALSWRDARPPSRLPNTTRASGPLILWGIDVVGQVHISQRTAESWALLARRWAASERLYEACNMAAILLHAGHDCPLEACLDVVCRQILGAMADASAPQTPPSRGGAI